MQLDVIRPVFDSPGPFVTVHLDVSRATQDARQQLDARLTSARRELERGGVSGALVEKLEERLREQTHVPGEVRRTVVASAEEVVFDDVRSGHTIWPETVSVGPLPDLAGWASLVDGQFPFVLVQADRVGADIDVYAARGRPVEAHSEVDGSTFDLTKVAEGDWAHDKYQQRAENTWEANAKLVADQVRVLCERYRPRVVVIAGDVRAKADLVQLLEGEQGVEIETIGSGGRAAGTSDEAMWDEIRRLLAAYEARDQVDLVQRLERGTANQTGVARGLENVVDALVRGEVDRLVLDLDAAREMTLDAGDHPGLPVPEVAMTAGPLPADQVLLAAAARTGAELSVLPRDLSHGAGVAATLRWG